MTPENRNNPVNLGTGRRANVYGPRNGLARVVNQAQYRLAPATMPLRSRLASCALAVVLLQLTMLFAVPFSACCAEERSEIVDCCPPGSHPPGECPLHRSARKNTQTSSADCRIRCAAPQAVAFIAGVVGILPPSAAAPSALLSFDVIAIRADRPIAGAAHPDLPPPKLL